MQWDDLKVLLALARRGSARGAAQELGVSNSTVTRRLDELEHRLGTRLFDRTPDGYRMTAPAEELLPTAEQVEELVIGAERRFTGVDQELRGTIRLTMPPSASLGILLDPLSEFARQYPGIELELMPSNEALDLSRREADIAIRVMPVGARPPETLIGRRVGEMTSSTYVHRDLLDPDDPERVEHLVWIGKRPFGEREDWLENTEFPDHPVRHSIEDFDLLLPALQQKMGMAYLPCVIVRDQPDIVRVPGAGIRHTQDLWILTHKDLRLSARMRVLRDTLAEAFAARQSGMDSRLEG